MTSLPVLALLVLAPALGGRAAASEPAAPTGHDAATTPIDCPLHGKGVSQEALKPFAQTEQYIQFLERPDRALWQKPDAVVRALGLAGTETLADVGAGSGYFTFRFAKALPKGRVVAIDIDPEMVRHVHHKVIGEGIGNVKVVLSDPTDPTIDAAADVVFICDVLHHVAGREAWLRKLYAEMKPGARLVVVEFKEGRLPQGPPEAMKVPKAALVAELEGVGLTLRQDRPELLPYQTFLVFAKPAAREAALGR